MKAMFRTKAKAAAAACVTLVVVTGCVGLAQEAAKQPPKQNVVHVATDGTGDYKADGTDDHVEINRALLDIHKKGGGTVHLKKGTYTIGDTIVIYSNTILEGAGWTSVIKLKDNVGWPRHKPMMGNEKSRLRLEGRNVNITIRNFKIDGNRPNQKEGWGGQYHNAISLSKISRATITGMHIGNNNMDAIIVGKESEHITVHDNVLHNYGHDGVALYCVSHATVRDNKFGIQCNAGIRLYRSNHIVLKNNIIRSLGAIEGRSGGAGGSAIQIQFERKEDRMNDILIHNNTIYETMGGIVLFTYAYPNPSDTKIVIRNNAIYHVSSSGVSINNFHNVILENNTIFNCGGDGVAFYESSHCKPHKGHRAAVVRNNIIANNKGYGLNTNGLDADFKGSYNNIWGNGRGDHKGVVRTKRDISVDPLFVNGPTKGWGIGSNLLADLHLKSTRGRRDGSKWLVDAVDSPCIDAGDPKSAYTSELQPNGGRINMGAYGNTAEASKGTGIARSVISGKVSDKTTGSPITKAKVVAGGYSGATDDKGNYTIADVPVGKYTLTVSATKYVEQVQDVKVSQDGETVADLGLEKEKVPPIVKSHSPTGKNPVGKIISVVFSEPMNAVSAEKSFSISPSAAGSFRWIGSTMYFIPDKPLEYGTKYKITVEGAEDLAGNKLQSPCVWEFSTLGQAEHLVGQWRFEEESGDTAKDSSGRDNHGALKGGPARVEGKVGKALSFDGADDCVEIPHNDTLIVREEITIEAWVKPNYQKHLQKHLFQHHCGIAGKFHRGYDGYRLITYATKGNPFRPGFIYFKPEGTGKRDTGTNFKWNGPFDSWAFLTVTRDFHGNVKTYVNGKLTNSVETDPVRAVIVGSEKPSPLWIGYTANGKKFGGIIDEVRIYNRALSAAEIKADFERTD